MKGHYGYISFSSPNICWIGLLSTQQYNFLKNGVVAYQGKRHQVYIINIIPPSLKT